MRLIINDEAINKEPVIKCSLFNSSGCAFHDRSGKFAPILKFKTSTFPNVAIKNLDCSKQHIDCRNRLSNLVVLAINSL